MKQTWASTKSNDKSNILLKIFNQATNYDGIQEDDIISRTESEDRIICFVIFLQFILAISATFLLTLFQKDSFIILTPTLSFVKSNSGFPVQHVALTFQDGSVYDLSLHDKISPSSQQIMKLPMDEYYFGFSDDLGFLHFISSTICRLITRYHPTSGHQTITQSSPKEQPNFDIFTEGIQVGNMFWVWGVKYKGKCNR